MYLYPRTRLFVMFIALLVSASLSVRLHAHQTKNQVYDPALYKAMKYRLIGPYRGGRVTAVTGIPDEPHTFYMGATGGGVWKTTDAGETWKNVSDGFFGVGSIGAIAVAPSDPNVVYVGTGSACPRGNVSIGDGLYKSTDAGKTWQHMGLARAGQIARVRIHPRDPDLVYVAVLGNVFGPNPERGVFRSTDGGRTWKKILFISEKTGAVDLSMDPHNPRVLYAGMWRVERKPWTLIDGGEEGGVYKTTDGGDTWTKLKGGLPQGLTGRIGVAVSPANSDRVWVLMEAQDGGGVFRSEDAGKTWTRINKERKLLQRHWYYCHIYADPQDENTVYALNTGFYKSIDGGKTFQRIRVPHGDTHDLWINPHDPHILINGNDGGACVSLNGGKTWSTQLNQPTAEFYRVTVDHQFPYRVYGAQQDNSTISIPSRSPGGITPKQYWYAVGGGESGHIAVDPRDPNIIYAGNYIGQITRLDRRSGHIRNITTYPQMHDGVAPRDMRYRFQWNAPIRLSPHDPDVLYHTSQYVHRSTDHGQTWEIISPDLTTNNDAYQDLPGGPIQHDHTGVEVYTTIFAFEESPHEPGVLWAGSDDGLVHISRNNGKTWENITPPDMPREGTVNMIELSAHDPGRAFIAVYRYRRNDFHPYIFRTNDYGRTWELLTNGQNGIPENHFVRVVREDPDRKGLLYAGTEFGMYVSFDDGKHWQSLQLNLPRTPITDLIVHEKDLIVATQGRSFWILDDLTPLHQLTDEVARSKAFLFKPRTTYRTRLRGFRGPRAPSNPPEGVMISYYFAEKPDGEVKLEILDAQGRVIRTFSSRKQEEETASEETPFGPREKKQIPAEAGMNRFSWNLTYPAPKLVKGAVMSLSYTGGPTAPPGTYQVRLTWGNWSQTQSFTVVKDPRWSVSDEDLRAQFKLTMAVLEKLNETHNAIRIIRAVKEQVQAIAERAVNAGYDEAIKRSANALIKKLVAIEEQLIQTKNESRQDPINFPPRLDNQIAYLYTVVNFQDARPTKGCYERFQDLKKELAGHLAELDTVLSKDLGAFNTLLDREHVERVIVPTQK